MLTDDERERYGRVLGMAFLDVAEAATIGELAAAVIAARDAELRQWLDDAITTCREIIADSGDAPIVFARWEGRLSAFTDMLFRLEGGDDGNEAH